MFHFIIAAFLGIEFFVFYLPAKASAVSYFPDIISTGFKVGNILETGSVKNISDEGIVKSITNLKSDLNGSLDGILRNLSDEFKKLEEIRAAIALDMSINKRLNLDV